MNSVSPSGKQIVCLKPFYQMDLLPAGRVFTCCPAYGNTEIGNTKDNGIKEIWNSSTAVALRDNLLKGNWASAGCKRTCPAIATHLATGAAIDIDHLDTLEYMTPLLASEIRAGKTVLDSTPTFVNFSNSPICNLDCITCASKFQHDDGALADKTMTAIVNYLPKTRVLFLTGNGDPFARPDTKRLLLTFDASMYPHIKIDLLTNGLLLPRFWEQIKHQPFRHINVSVDAATRETYEKIRRGGKWAKLLEALSLIKENRSKFSSVHINMTVLGDNYREIPLFIALGEEYGFNVAFSRVRTQGQLDPQQNFFDNDAGTLADFVKILNVAANQKYSIHVEWSNLIEFIRDDANTKRSCPA